MKKMIAYSSIAHMGFVTAGMFSLTQQGMEGSIFQMLSHGVVSSALFLCVGVVYDRLHTREIARYGGLANNMPKYAVFFFIMLLGSVGLPATSGFVGEFMIMLGIFQVNTWVATLVATGLILGATYMLLLYRKVIFGEITREDVRKMTDLTPREIVIFVPLALVVLWMGIYPSSFLNVMSVSVDHLITQYHADLGRAGAVAVAVR